jgi:hypothetical protein
MSYTPACFYRKNLTRSQVLYEIYNYQDIYNSDKITFLLSIIDAENFNVVVEIIDTLIGILKKEEIENDN